MLDFNILPAEEKKYVKNYRLVKTATIWNFSALATFVIMVFLLLPSYLLLALQKDEIFRNLKITEENVFIKKIEDVQTSLDALRKSADNIAKINESSGFFSGILTDLVSATPAGIVATGISFNSASSELIYDGIAENRAALIALENGLKNNKSFKNVSIPLASLVLEENIPFHLKINVAVP